MLNYQRVVFFWGERCWNHGPFNQVWECWKIPTTSLFSTCAEECQYFKCRFSDSVHFLEENQYISYGRCRDCDLESVKRPKNRPRDCDAPPTTEICIVSGVLPSVTAGKPKAPNTPITPRSASPSWEVVDGYHIRKSDGINPHVTHQNPSCLRSPRFLAAWMSDFLTTHFISAGFVWKKRTTPKLKLWNWW